MPERRALDQESLDKLRFTTECNKYNITIIGARSDTGHARIPMRPIATYVREILDESEVALTAMVHGYLNFSAYAKRIQPEVQRRARREVSVGTIVVALCRYESDARARSRLTPRVAIESISTRSALAEVTFTRSPSTRSRLRFLHENLRLLEAEVLTITSGVREVSFILPAVLKDELLKVFKGHKPTLVVEHLASITLRFSPRYLNIPNTIFALLRPLALNRINIVEVVSTYTEMTMIVAEKDLQAAFGVVSKLPTT